jgi:23S rRNA (uracil1939-C5)-methyltransferase
MSILELEVASLAAGGDGVARDETGRVTFVPRAAPGDRVRVRLVQQTKSFARGELVDVLVAGVARVAPPCPHFVAGCGGCQWQHVARAEQLAAKQTIVTGALRKLDGLTVHSIVAPSPALGWRRRARFHVGSGVGLYRLGTHAIVPIDHCPQLEPALDAAYAAVAAASPPAGELALLLGHQGHVAVATTRPWKRAERLIGTAGIRGLQCGDEIHGDPVLEVEPGLWGGVWDFAQASAAGNAELIRLARGALPAANGGALLELYAGAGNLTRGLVADGWRVIASDLAAPSRPIEGAQFLAAPAAEVFVQATGPFDAIVLDPPRTGAADAIDGIVALAPRTIVYVSCDPATLARDAMRLAAAGYRATDAWPIDLMPETAHVEVVMRLEKA